MLDGTEVDEEAFNCLNQSPEDATYTFIATTDSWVSGKSKLEFTLGMGE